ncbi:MAG: Topoisomerase IA (Type III) [Promethearchaeota archaeon]|nr:MAG: Topoisomerase IA (Type III) [Candidatus Lokiarchaeota archaeon]
MTTLIISEKNKAGRAIAEALGSVKKIKKSRSLNIYTVPSRDIYVLPLRGHIMEYQNTEKFKSWSKSDPRKIITNPDSIEKVPKKYAYPYIKALKEYGKRCNKCIIGTDADNEGCNIGLFDALPFIKEVNKNISISQLWLSSLEKNEIQSKYQNPIRPKWSWGETAEARAIIDAVIGFSATREVTNTLKPLLSKFKRYFVSIGRVQTSLLYLIYLREKQIEDFNPEPYFTIDAILIYKQNRFKAYHKENPFKKDEEKIARTIFNKIKGEKIAKVIQNLKDINKRYPPNPLNTSKALVLLTKNLGISASLAFKIMNQLYLNKIITYPRTDSDVYKETYDHISKLQKFRTSKEYGNYAKELLKKNRLTPTKGRKDAGDHPPITPLKSLGKNSNEFKNSLEWKVYDILARHYLSLFGEKALESKTTLKLEIEDEIFISRLVNLISPGFLEIAPFLRRKYDSTIDVTDKNIPIDSIKFNEKETKPPPAYTDTTLLKLMEKHNLGTKSTRPVIMNILEDRDLIYKSKRRYKITDLGKFLIDQLKEVWLPFLKPEFTGKLERLLEEIQNNNKNLDEVINKVRKEFLDLFDKFRANKKKLISKINTYQVNSKKHQKKNYQLTTSNCPYCNSNPMKLIRAKKRFLVCSDKTCNKYLSLPKKGRLYMLKSTCSICGFNIFKVYRRKNGKKFHYYFCPYCWNVGLERNISGKGFCSSCKDYEIKNNQCQKK